MSIGHHRLKESKLKDPFGAIQTGTYTIHSTPQETHGQGHMPHKDANRRRLYCTG
jgi:hypothetical protein